MFSLLRHCVCKKIVMVVLFGAIQSYATDLTVEGNLNVGNSSTKGGVTIAGQTGSAAAPGLIIAGDGGVVWTGSFGTGAIPASDAGTRLMWYPKKAAFRAGSVISTEWNDANIGEYSVAFGQGSTAAGKYSFAAGSAEASGYSAFAGGSSNALGLNSFAVGDYTTATGWASVALGMSTNATGYWATALGFLTTASGDRSLAVGGSSTASGTGSFAQGFNTVASGSTSVALGQSSISSGNYAFSSGYYVAAVSAYSAVFGRFNAIEGSGTAWSETDPLFVIGNGTGVTTDPPNVKSRNALTVYKNGDIKITKRQGDIEMGGFGVVGSGD